MELRHLRYFIAVAEELHFTRAAERLHIGQPPLSHAIQMLEADVGAQLFERSKRWVRLTEAGKLFLQDARHILALSEQASETARRAQRGETGELRIGFTFSTPFTPLFAAVINGYRQQYPDVTLTLREMATNKQLEALSQHSLDVGFIRPPEGGELARGVSSPLRFKTLREDPLVVVLPTTHALAKKKKVPMQDLAQLPFIMYPPSAGTGIYPHILRLCHAAGFAPRVTQEANDASTIIGLVAAGCGISILPGSFYTIHFDGICYRPVADAGATTSLLLAQRKDEVSPLVAAFVGLAAELA
ncbi:LysR family transcriptional regulator [Undibacterium sp. CY18W]|uniref:LysR family transcriptional regulator n=1 Tax=Undibacterium hunanense TaxID=2762292 RepID=A0ABR6ZWH1_9BURK|nr:LysR substrate-binding domain-containing protein [Undibacterium hunanense]MBC3919958.1 LysR family transcriptional regulator [Undibacterium hunanense]